MRSNLKRNVLLQTAYQVLSAIVPLITAPYIARVLGARQIGVYSYTLTIVNYFVIFAMLGISTYASRAIAKVQGDKTARSACFWNIYLMQLCSSLAALGAYTVYVLTLPGQDQAAVLALQGLWLAASALDISWYFFGVEKVQSVVIRNLIVKVATVALIFILVKSPDDLAAYTLIMGGGVVISQILLWPFLRQEVAWHRPAWRELKTHVAPNLRLFIPVVSTSVYRIMDKTMVGFLAGFLQLGYYYNADKVVNVPLVIFSGLGVVFLPGFSALIAAGRHGEARRLMAKSIEVYAFATMAIAFGLAAVVDAFSSLFFGPGYDECAVLIRIFSPMLVVKAFGSLILMQCLLPGDQEKLYIRAIWAGVALNLALNFTLIPLWGARGAVLATLAAESVVCGIEIYAARKEIPMAHLFQQFLVYGLSGATMYLSVQLIAGIEIGVLWKLLVEMVAGAAVYMGLCLAYWRMSGKTAMPELILGALRRKPGTDPNRR